MPLQQYIINDIKPLNINDKVSDLKMMFNELTYSHIPIENEGNEIPENERTDKNTRSNVIVIISETTHQISSTESQILLR